MQNLINDIVKLAKSFDSTNPNLADTLDSVAERLLFAGKKYNSWVKVASINKVQNNYVKEVVAELVKLHNISANKEITAALGNWMQRMWHGGKTPIALQQMQAIRQGAAQAAATKDPQQKANKTQKVIETLNTFRENMMQEMPLDPQLRDFGTKLFQAIATIPDPQNPSMENLSNVLEKFITVGVQQGQQGQCVGPNCANPMLNNPQQAQQLLQNFLNIPDIKSRWDGFLSSLNQPQGQTPQQSPQQAPQPAATSNISSAYF